MNNSIGFNLGSVGAMMIALSAAIMVVAVPINVAASAVSNSEHMIYASGSPPDDTTGEPTGGSDIGSSAVVAILTVSKGPQGNSSFNPQTTTIKTGGEILILNNDTVAHTIRNGMSPDDPLSGRLFEVGPIEPRGFIEYTASNLQPGTYSFYSTSDPSMKGELVVTK